MAKPLTSYSSKYTCQQRRRSMKQKLIIRNLAQLQAAIRFGRKKWKGWQTDSIAYGQWNVRNEHFLQASSETSIFMEKSRWFVWKPTWLCIESIQIKKRSYRCERLSWGKCQLGSQFTDDKVESKTKNIPAKSKTKIWRKTTEKKTPVVRCAEQVWASGGRTRSRDQWLLWLCINAMDVCEDWHSSVSAKRIWRLWVKRRTAGWMMRYWIKWRKEG